MAVTFLILARWRTILPWLDCGTPVPALSTLVSKHFIGAARSSEYARHSSIKNQFSTSLMAS
jgi:hypothetical protein